MDDLIYRGRKCTICQQKFGDSHIDEWYCNSKPEPNHYSIWNLSNSGEWVERVGDDDGWWATREELEQFILMDGITIPDTPEYDNTTRRMSDAEQIPGG